MILILGSPEETHARHLYDHFVTRNVPVAYFNSQLFPQNLQIHLTQHSGSITLKHPENPTEQITLGFEEIQSVYWRSFMGVDVQHLPDPYQREMALREFQSTLGSFFRNLDCLWVNSVHAIEQHKFKAHQLKLIAEKGIAVPDTLITTDGDLVREFFETHKQQVIFKPVVGGAHTTKLTAEDLTDDRLGDLSNGPVQFQQYIPGTDIRVYWLNGECFAGEILPTLSGNSADFRDDPEAKIKPIRLPGNIQAHCATVAHTLGLVFTGIDIRRTTEDDYIFLEANPSPMFLHFERQSGCPITQRLAETLLQKSRHKLGPI